MDDFREIYDRIKFLRSKGVRMKDIAERTGFAPSVLSALFTTVLPAYFKNTDKGMSGDEALDNALVWVNNVSKKKLLGSAAGMKTALLSMDVEPQVDMVKGGNPYLAAMETAMRSAAGQISGLCGTYLSYSMSSSSKAMKIEPYLIATSADGSYVEVVHNNAYGSTHRGMVLMNGRNHIYIMFNENSLPQLALFNICLKIPMYDRPPFLRGVYTCFDYNYNPIARRIIFVKRSDSVSRTEFAELSGSLKEHGELTDGEKAYYNYTCGAEDVVRMCNVPSPRMSEADLVEEKRLISSFFG